jgi:hypothetical protein
MKHTKENKTDRKVPKSNSTCAPYNKFWMKKSQNLPVWLSKMVLAQQNGFGPAFLHSMLRLVIGTAKPNTCR